MESIPAKRSHGAERSPAIELAMADLSNYREVYAAEPQVKIAIIRQGIPIGEVKQLATRMNLSTNKLGNMMHLPSSTLARKGKLQAPLTPDQSERLLGLTSLIGMVEQMVDESGGADDFDAAAWLSDWLEQPLPALGGRPPAEYLDTIAGQEVIRNLLLQMQGGSFA